MADSIQTIAVNGQHGNDIWKARGAGTDDNSALVRYGTRRDKNGEAGQDAEPALPGGPGGSLTVEMTESTENEGDICVTTMQWEGATQPARATQVSGWRTILLSATGGNGGNGHNGGDGGSGLDGTEGVAATPNTDAEDGTDGGNGGDAGRGSDGANGGDGGKIQILLGSHSTHLLHMVKWNVSGGKGGLSGRHGNVGTKGKGGAGGPGHKWEQFMGYRYYCTPNCLGRNDVDGTSLVRFGSTIRRTDDHLTDRLRAVTLGPRLIQGNNLQSAVAAVALRIHASQQRPAGVGRCRCAGGNSGCLGCESREVKSMLQRNPGQPGNPGRDGQPRNEPLRDGLPGNSGQVIIVVQDTDGTIREYSEPWKLRLVSFDLEDENADGIFEPGERVLIRRVSIHNTGGMPSPLAGAELLVKSFDGIEPDRSVRLFVPPSIPANSTVTLDGYLAARISPESVIGAGKPYVKRNVKVSLSAIMPWLNCTLDDVEFEASFDVQSPCAISSVRVSPSFSPGCLGVIEWDVLNRGGKAIGSLTADARHVEVVTSIPSIHGTFQADEIIRTASGEQVSNDMAQIKPKTLASASRVLEIFPNVHAPIRFEAVLSLYVSDPAEPYAADNDDDDGAANMVHVQTVRVPIHVSESYQSNALGDVLLVTSSATPPERVTTLQGFVRDELKMTVDTWDINLHGVHIFSKYPSKTIILLGEAFSFCSADERVMTELCDSRQVCQSLTSNTSFLALGLQDTPMTKGHFRQTVFNVQSPLSDTVAATPKSAKFSSVESLATAIVQSRLNGDDVLNTFKLTTKQRHRDKVLKRSPDQEVEAVSRQLRTHLPQSRFLICPIQRPTTDTTSSFNEFIVFLGIHRNAQMHATEKRGTFDGSLDSFERYCIIAALQAVERIRKLMADTNHRSGSYAFIREAAFCSLAIDSVREIESFAFSDFGNGSPKLPKPGSKAELDFLRIHVPTIAAILLEHGQTSEAILDVLTYCVAACKPQSARQKLAGTITLSNTVRQRLGNSLNKIINARFNTDLSKRADELKGDTMEHLVQRTAKLTRLSEHAFKNSFETSLDAVPGSEICTTAEWDERFEVNSRAWTRIEEEERQVQERVGGATTEVFSC